MIISDFAINGVTKFTAQTPTQPLFYDDEIELWFTDERKNICIFKDSYSHAFCAEIPRLLDIFQSGSAKGTNYENVSLSKTYFELVLADKFDDIGRIVEDFLLFENGPRMVWLYPVASNYEVGLEIGLVNPYDDSPSFIVEEKMVISRIPFFLWLRKLSDGYCCSGTELK